MDQQTAASGTRGKCKRALKSANGDESSFVCFFAEEGNLSKDIDAIIPSFKNLWKDKLFLLPK